MGLTNKTLINALSELVNKPFNEVIVAFIPTAANIVAGGKEWLIGNFNNFLALGVKELDIVDLSALPKDRWLPRLENADVLVFGGGNAYYLMHWLIKSGLKEELPSLLENKVYVGISAGSMVTTTNFQPTVNHDVELYGEELVSEEKIDQGLGFVDFHIIPHINAPFFPKARFEHITDYATKTSDTIYAIDDTTAIKVIANNIEVISEGEWKKFN